MVFGKSPSFGGEKTPKKEKNISKTPIRDAAFSFLVGAGGATAGIQPILHWNEIRTHFSEPLRERSANTREVRELIEARYGIKVTFDLHPLNLSYESDEMTSEDAVEALGFLLDALASYPPDFFERNRIEEIVLVSNLRQERRRDEQYFPEGNVGGYARGDLRQFVIKHQSSQGTFKSVFDHELLHVLERINNTESMRAEWNALQENCSNCYPYGTVPATPLEGMAGDDIPINPFANSYGSFNPQEDRATYAQMLFTPLTHVMLIDWIAGGWTEEERMIRQAKYDLITSAYEQWSGGVMDEAYWAEIIRTGRQEQEILMPPGSVSIPSGGQPQEWYVPYSEEDYYEPYVYEMQDEETYEVESDTSQKEDEEHIPEPKPEAGRGEEEIK